LGKRVACNPNDYNYQAPVDPAQFPLSTWTHMAQTFDGTTYRVYVNGTVVHETGGGGGTDVGPPNSAPLRIGTSGTCAPFGGLMDEVKIYNRALSQAEVQATVAADTEGTATQVVTTSADIVNLNDAVTSLREAITASNTVAGKDVIGFDIPNMPTDPTSWYKAEDDPASTVAKDSTGGNNGSRQGTVPIVPGEVGQAFSFDGNPANFV